MLITLQLVATPQGPVDDEPVRSFEDEQIVIGRAPNCHVVLPDGLRIISRQHARLTSQRGEVLITCLSASAPVRVNDVSVPHGGVLGLRHGDVIHIGGFDLRLSARVLAPEPPLAAPVAAPVDVPISVPLAAVAALPVAGAAPAIELAPARRARARLDEWFDLEPAPAAPAGPSPGARPAVPAASPFASGAGLAVDLDLRSGAHPAVQLKGTQSRIMESLQQVLSPPAEVPEPQAASPLIAPVAVPEAGPVVAPQAAAGPTPQAVLAPAPVSVASPPPGPSPAEAPESDAGLVLLDVSSSAALPAEPPAFGDPVDAELMQAFLEGAGLAPRVGATNTQVISPMALTPAWMRHIGQLLRASVEGSLALLHSRSTVKREMRAEVTVIARRQNNPLKFAPDALAALAHLVAAKRTPGFLEPVAALKDAHEDLLLHHLAVVAGMRAAMFELIARLGPDDVVRDEGPPKGLAMTLPTLQEAALWRRYRQRHAEMTARLDDDFETVFGREFTKAYEAQARRVREQAPPEDTTS